MATIADFWKRIRISYRRSSNLTRILILSAIVLSMAALLVLHQSIDAAGDRTGDLSNQAAQLEKDNQELEENIDNLGSADSVGQIAKDELGMVDGDTVIIDPTE